MKILKIRFKNIHSLRGEHEIDFAGGLLAEAGLFVITGATGSGKSTLLDVITLALYNRIPRIDKLITNTIIEETGVIMTKNTDDCYVEVEYEVKEKKYLSSWSIKKNRNKNLSDRKQELTDLQTQVIIADKKGDVVTKNEEIIGLNYEQFVQSMILAQGQFSKLLLSAKDERNKLLEEITGASIYREIGRRTYRKFVSAQTEVKDQHLRMEGIEILDEETIENLEIEKKQSNEQITILKKKIQTLTEKINHTEGLEKKEQDLLAKNKEWSEHEVEKNSRKNDKIRLQSHKKLRHFQSELDRLENKTLGLKQALKDENEISADIQKVEKDLTETLNAASKLLKKEIEKELFNEDLQEFKKKVSVLIEKANGHNRNARQHVEGIKNQIKHLRNFDVEIDHDQKADFILKEIELKKASFVSEIAKSGFDSLDVVKQEGLVIQSTIDKAESLKDKKQLDENTRNLIADYNNEINDRKKEITSFETDLKKIEVEFETLNKELPDLEKQVSELHKTKSLEDYRTELQEGEACPLCGSTEHPYATELKKQNISLLEEQLNQKKRKLEEVNNTKIKISTNISNAEKFINERNEKIKAVTENNKETLNAIIQKAKELKWPENISLEEVKKKISEIDLRKKDLTRLEKTFPAADILADLQKVFLAYQKEKEQFEIFKTEKDALYTGDDIDKDVSKLTENFNRQTTSAESLKISLAKVLQRKELLEKEKTETSEKLLKELSAHEVFSIEELKNKLLSPKEADDLERELEELKNKSIKLNSIIESLRLEIGEMRKKTELIGDINKLKEEKNVFTTEESEQNKKLGNIENQLRNNEDQKAKFSTEKAKLEKLQADLDLWKKMNQLIGDAEGKKFSNFVQDLTLKQLIQFGNKRLSAFTDRYILDVPQQDESSVLKVMDTYMGNSRRSVSTLSGGETFKISLALAIGLSDLAAKNVRIDSLFIDEGFGSLDPESLDQAISILEQMQNENNKSIGIISHVNELKERITTRINMKKTGAGYSEIEIE
ncbi:MAG: hypothetical protein EA412_11355 [Chitinophagaceae bacterium]|nr:MAG: hypothetical protein EA412_11355 [Chitinophagaceae bacterium]